jgi:soluble lytic murein transglycosylase-like protein
MMIPYTKKIALLSIIFALIAIPGFTGTISDYQHVLTDIERSPAPLPAVHARISSTNLSGTASVSNTGKEPVKTDPPAQRNAKLHRLSQFFNPIIHKAADEFEIDPALIKAVIMAESRYNPKAVSKRGAKGLMQLMPATAKSLGVTDSFDPEDNIFAGSRYLKTLIKKFDGDIELALAAYNAGTRHVKKYGGVPPFKQTRQYIHKVFKYHRLYKEDV